LEPSAWVAGSVPGWSPYSGTGVVYQSRFVSDEGRVFFDSPTSLVPLDVNGVGDVYEWEPEGIKGPAGGVDCSPGSSSGSDVFEPAHPFTAEGGAGGESPAGCVALISSGTSGEESAFMDASQSGGDVFFLSSSKLAPSAVEGGQQLYDAHQCTSAAPCPVEAVAPPACTSAEGCRGAPAPQPPIYGPPPSATFNGPGNTPPPPPPPAVVKRLATKSVRCKKHFTKRHGRCVRTKRTKAKRSFHTNRRTKR
jgi:hypothetical protein